MIRECTYNSKYLQAMFSRLGTKNIQDNIPGVHTCSRYSSSGNMFSEHVLGTHHF